MCTFSIRFIESLGGREKLCVPKGVDSLQCVMDALLEVFELANRSKQRIRLEGDLLVQTNLHQVQITGQLQRRGNE